MSCINQIQISGKHFKFFKSIEDAKLQWLQVSHPLFNSNRKYVDTIN
jgi:hypothetical protein